MLFLPIVLLIVILASYFGFIYYRRIKFEKIAIENIREENNKKLSSCEKALSEYDQLIKLSTKENPKFPQDYKKVVTVHSKRLFEYRNIFSTLTNLNQSTKIHQINDVFNNSFELLKNVHGSFEELKTLNSQKA